MRKCPRCGVQRSRFSHRNPVEKVIGLVLQARPFRCGACMKRFWWFSVNRQQLKRHRHWLLVGGVFLLAIVVTLVYVKTLPYEAERPREAGVRSPAPTLVEPQDEAALTDGLDGLDLRPDSEPSLPGMPELANGAETPNGETEEIPLALPAPPPFEASTLRDSGELLDIVSVQDEVELHLLLRTDAPPRTFQHFQLPNPDRLVVDIQGRWTTELPSALPLDHALTEGLRIGKHEDMVRIVVQLKTSAIMPPDVEVRGDGLALVLRSSRRP